MRMILPIAFTIALVGSTGLASAEEAQGKLGQHDPTTNTIMLEDGSVFVLGTAVSLEGIEPGEEVTVSYELDDDGQKVADSIEPASADEGW